MKRSTPYAGSIFRRNFVGSTTRDAHAEGLRETMNAPQVNGYSGVADVSVNVSDKLRMARA